jgi:hypothetical protein
MEDGLAVYKDSYDARHPVDLHGRQQQATIKEVRQPMPGKPGAVENTILSMSAMGSVICSCSLSRTAACGRDRSTHRGGLGAANQTPDGCALPSGPTDYFGDG